MSVRRVKAWSSWLKVPCPSVSWVHWDFSALASWLFGGKIVTAVTWTVAGTVMALGDFVTQLTSVVANLPCTAELRGTQMCPLLGSSLWDAVALHSSRSLNSHCIYQMHMKICHFYVLWSTCYCRALSQTQVCRGKETRDLRISVILQIWFVRIGRLVPGKS